MPECARQRADDFHSEIPPEFYRRLVARNHEIKLHRSKTEPAGFVQAMFSHRPTDSLSTRTFCDYEPGIRDVRTAGRLILAKRITTKYLLATP